MEQRQSFRQQHLFTDVALQSCGFQIANKKDISRALYRVQPTGKRSSLFSAIIQALYSLKNLYLMIEDSGTAQNWRLSLVIIVSDNDSSSPMDWKQVKRVYQETKSRIQVQRFQVIFVAYNIEQSRYQQLFFLQGLDQFGQTPLHLASSQLGSDGYQNFGRLMQRIRDVERLGNRKQGVPSIIFQGDAMRNQINDQVKQKVKGDENPYLGQISNYGIMFAISETEKYQGDAWVSLCHGVHTFCKYLGGEDLFGCMIFGEQCKYFMKDRFVCRGQPIVPVYNPGPAMYPGPPILYPNHQQHLNAPLLQPGPNQNRQMMIPQRQANPVGNAICNYVLARICIFLIILIIGGIIAASTS